MRSFPTHYEKKGVAVRSRKDIESCVREVILSIVCCDRVSRGINIDDVLYLYSYTVLLAAE